MSRLGLLAADSTMPLLLRTLALPDDEVARLEAAGRAALLDEDATAPATAPAPAAGGAAAAVEWVADAARGCPAWQRAMRMLADASLRFTGAEEARLWRAMCVARAYSGDA
jgi:hypothetical protein